MLVVLLLAACSPPESVTTPETEPEIRFTDITAEAGLGDFRHTTGGFGQRWHPEIVGAGGGFLDYDNDGDSDLLLVRGGVFEGHGQSVPALALYQNDGTGGFTEVTEAAGLADFTAYGFGITAADYDNDGDQDVLFTTLHQDYLFRNDGGVFTDVTDTSGLGETQRWSSSAAFFDANDDGWLDLYVGHYIDWSPENDLVCVYEGEKVFCTPEEYDGIPSRFYVSNRDGTFTDRTEAAGFAGAPGKTFGVSELDFNRDGRPDLVVANDTQPDLLYRNEGEGRFTEIGVASGLAFDENGRARAGMGLDVGVVDETGEETVFVGNFSEEMIGVYRHLRNGLFMDRAAASKIGHPSVKTLTFGLILFDPDLDSDLDLLAANGHVQTHIEQLQEGVTFRQPPQLFRNVGEGQFEELQAGPPFQTSMVARGLAYADIDGDGDQDILFTENGGPVHLWRNDQTDNRYLRVRLEGRESNRDALGARVVAVVGERRLERRIRTGRSFLSQSEKVATFGLGQADRVDSVIVHWPSGGQDVLTDIEANQELNLIEGDLPA